LTDAPRGFWQALHHTGPGLIIAASIVGSGELIVTTKLGADVGFVLLWFILAGCLIKVFVQIELGRYAIAHSQTTLQALNSLPGPRARIGWMVYIWLAMYVATFFQLAGMVGSIAEVFRLGGSNWSERTWAMLITLSCAVLMAVGRYRLIERASSIMVALFTALTVLAVVDAVRDSSGPTLERTAVPIAGRFYDRLRCLRDHRRRSVGVDLLSVLVPRKGLRTIGRPQRRQRRMGRSRARLAASAFDRCLAVDDHLYGRHDFVLLAGCGRAARQGSPRDG
jgi:hypothetical protein